MFDYYGTQHTSGPGAVGAAPDLADTYTEVLTMPKGNPVPMPLPTNKVVERFWSKVDKSGDCWIWTGCINAAGYGRMNIAGLVRLAHRLSYWFTNGVDPGELIVCHRCDNPPCVNPDHMFLGTDADNVRDMIAKGRQADRPLGELSPRSVISDETVARLRERRKAGETVKDLAAEAGVSAPHMSRVLSGKRRGGEPVTPPDVAAKGVAMYQAGISTVEVGRQLGVYPATVTRWLQRAGVPARSITEALLLHHAAPESSYANGWMERHG